MAFKIIDVEMYASPRNLNVDNILEHYLTTCEEIKNALKECTFRHNNTEKGFQIELHEQLQDFFCQFFSTKGLSAYSMGYALMIALESDVGVQSKTNGKRVYIEIEFRPNEFKDIVKFQIGYKHKLELGILVVAKNRKNINRKYTTMPDYKKCKNIIVALEPECPILLVGLDGERC